jgi:hypothetical protein
MLDQAGRDAVVYFRRVAIIKAVHIILFAFSTSFSGCALPCKNKRLQGSWPIAVSCYCVLFYSVRKFFTGLERAAFTACMLMVKKAISKAMAQAASRIHTVKGAL